MRGHQAAALGCSLDLPPTLFWMNEALPLPPRNRFAGDLFVALRRSGALRHMRRAGLRCLDVHTVEDNLVARVADPVFIGGCP